MTEFQQWLHDVYHDIKDQTRREDGSYNTEAENEAFMDRFGIADRDNVDSLLSGVHCAYWNQVDDALERIYTEEDICLQTVFGSRTPEEIVI